MKVKYEFTNETAEIDVAEEWGTTLLDYDRMEYNNNQTERRRHTSLDGMDYAGEVFDSGTDILADVLKADGYYTLHQAIARLTPEQQRMVHAIFFEGVSINEYAKFVGVDHSAISHRLRTIYKNLRKSL